VAAAAKEHTVVVPSAVQQQRTTLNAAAAAAAAAALIVYFCMLCCAAAAGCKSNDVQIVYTPWSNLKKTASMDVGQVGEGNALVGQLQSMLIVLLALRCVW
jgi:hypothetical protein